MGMLNVKKTIITKDSLQKSIKNIVPITKNFEYFNKNIYNNMKNIFDSDEKKKNIISYLDDKIKREREQRSISPLLNSNSSSVKSNNNNNIYYNQKKQSKKLIKDYQAISQEYSNAESLNKVRYSSTNMKNLNIHHMKQYSNNNIGKLFYFKDDENDEVNKKINEMRRSIKNQIDKEFPIKVYKNDNLQITFLRINITTLKHENEEKEFKKEQFNICINSLNKNNRQKDIKKDNIFKKEFSNFCIKGNDKKENNFIQESVNFYVKGNNKKEIIFEKEFNNFTIEGNNKKEIILEKEYIDFEIKGINEKEIEEEKDFSGFKFTKIENGEKINEFYIKENIEELNKKFEEENITINNLPLKFSSNIKSINEIDQVEKFEFIQLNNLNKKENKKLINIGVNTMKDKRKFENKGISVNFFPITTQIGINTDDIENRINNNNNDNNNIIKINRNKYNYENENKDYLKKNNTNIFNVELKNYNKGKIEKRSTTSKEKLQKALKEYIDKRIELEADDYILENSSNNSYQGNYSQLENSQHEVGI